MEVDDESVELFGFEFSKYTVLDDEIRDLFYMIRQELGQLERFSKLELGGSSDARDVCSAAARRILQFLRYLKQVLPSQKDTPTTLQKVGECLSQLLVFMGPLSDLEWTVTTSLTKVHVAIHRELIEIIPLFDSVRISLIQTVEDRTLGYVSPSLADGYVQFIMWDLTLVAVRIHAKVQLADYRKCTPFPITEQRHLWRELKRLMATADGEQFWVSVLEILTRILAKPRNVLDPKDAIDSSLYLIPPEMECDNVRGFCWWFLAHMVRELEERNPDVAKPSSVKIMSFAKSLLSATLKQDGGLPEPELRCYLRCLVRVCDVMDVNVDVIISLWDLHFRKKMNSACSMPAFGLKAFADSGESKSSSAWYTACDVRVRAPADCSEEDSSFHLFLRLVALQISRLPADSQGWRQMKSRVLVRCNQRSMNELNRAGLINFTSLFITLAMLNEGEEMLEKLASYYKMLNLDKLTSDFKLVLTKAPFLALHLAHGRSVSAEKVAAYAAECFARVSRKFAATGPEFEEHHTLWTRITAFLESASELLEFGQKYDQLAMLLDCKCGEKTVLSTITDTMRVCSKPEAKHILDVLQSWLERVCDAVNANSTAPGIQGLCTCLWTCVYPYVREEVLRPLASVQLADMAVQFTLLAEKGKGVQFGYSAKSCFAFFATHQDVQASVTCRYLCRLLVAPSGEHLMNECGHVPLVEAWVKCSLLAGDEARADLEALNRFVETNIPSMQPLLVPLRDSTETGLPTMFKNLAANYATRQGFMDRMQYRESVTQYFTMYQKYASTLLKHQVAPQVFSNVVRMSALLFQDCSPMIYTKSKPNSLLVYLLNNLLLPRDVYDQNKPLPAHIAGVMQEYLPMFLRGLAVLEYKRDPLLQRAIRDIVCQYANRFPLKVERGTISSHMNHPVVAAICDVTTLNDDVMREFRLNVLDCVVQNFIQHGQKSVGINFYDRVVQKSSSRPSLIASDCTVMLLPLLNYLLLGDETAVKETSSKVLKTALQCLQQYGQSYCAVVAQQIKQFVNTHARTHQLKVFRLLQPVARLCPAALRPISGDLADYVIMTEKNRGIKSTETQLRQLCIDILKSLGPEAEENLKRLTEIT